ncbi:50S ribosomal protein L18e [Candidatus Bathyarchaeota archaeon]|nr:MAG: 50S ribosomal protein L18e [Candidatus Bathyarchaeota archaeon]
MVKRGPTNPELLHTIGYLRSAGRKYQAPLWLTVAKYLAKSRRSRIVLNLGQVSRHAKDGDVVVVPGKVLGSGDPNAKVTIAAYKFSPKALVKVGKAGGRCIPLSRLVEENPHGTNVRLLS